MNTEYHYREFRSSLLARAAILLILLLSWIVVIAMILTRGFGAVGGLFAAVLVATGLLVFRLLPILEIIGHSGELVVSGPALAKRIHMPANSISRINAVTDDPFREIREIREMRRERPYVLYFVPKQWDFPGWPADSKWVGWKPVFIGFERAAIAIATRNGNYLVGCKEAVEVGRNLAEFYGLGSGTP
jgi:hypothetical protein